MAEDLRTSAQKSKAPVLAGLDLGSTCVKYVLSTVTPDGKVEVAGIGKSPNHGVKQGVVVNIEATTEAIRRAKEEAELMAGFSAHKVCVSVSGSHIKSFDSRGMVAIKNTEVSKTDIDRVLEAAKAVAVPGDRKVLHVIPRDFKVDGQDGVSDPIGMSGVRLEASVHIVTAAQSALSNLTKCIERAGLTVERLVLDPLAASMSVLSEDEKNLGVCLADIGGGSCHLLYFVNGSVAHTSLIPIGGSHFTHDVAVGLRTPQISAEVLKVKHGCAMGTLTEENETIEVEGVGGRKARGIPRKDLADILEARSEEILGLIAHDLKISGLLPMLGSGVVLTGGASQLEGLTEMGEFIFDVPVRRGVPGKIGGLVEVVRGAEFATVVGLLLFAYEEKKDSFISLGDFPEALDGIAQKVKDFVGQLFR